MQVNTGPSVNIVALCTEMFAEYLCRTIPVYAGGHRSVIQHCRSLHSGVIRDIVHG
jgi:hypothetical protein